MRIGPRAFAPPTDPLRLHRGRSLFHSAIIEGDHQSLWPRDIAKLYGLPDHLDGRDQCVGILALAGGYFANDVKASADGTGQDCPELTDYSAGSPIRSFGADKIADQELALDVQVLAGILPRARLVVYFASNELTKFPAALDTVLNDSVNRPSVLSISWGAPEDAWVLQDNVWKDVQTRLSEFAARGVSVLAASGDDLATDGVPGSPASVWFPGSSPDVLCCGGTTIALSSDRRRIASEVVWNNVFSGTGGGISRLFEIPAYQRTSHLPLDASDGHVGRGVPDIAAAADPNPGYRIVVDKEKLVGSGTSAATPLWAGLIALANSERGRNSACTHTYLYSNRIVCKPIVEGNNRTANGVGYDAGADWNACTGLGSPHAGQVITGLSSTV